VERTAALLLFFVLTLAAGCSREATEPTVLSCQVITGSAEPVTVKYPLYPNESTEPTQVVEVDGLLGVTIFYTGDVLDVYAYDTLDYLRNISWARSTGWEHLEDVSEVGDEILDLRGEHPRTRQAVRVLCEAA
jgi:hypothetical protein